MPATFHRTGEIPPPPGTPTFTDSASRVWWVRLNLHIIDVARVDGIDLEALAESTIEEALAFFATDPAGRVGHLLGLMLRHQAARLGVSADDFGRDVATPAVWPRAVAALFEAIAAWRPESQIGRSVRMLSDAHGPEWLTEFTSESSP